MSAEQPLAKRQIGHFADAGFVFLDRDGVINQKPPDGSYVTSWQGCVLLPGVERAIALLNQSLRKVIVVTNQRGIALGKYSEAGLAAIHESLRRHLNSSGAHLDAIYFCPHDYGQCSCRKPAIGLFEQAFHDFPEASAANSVMIGDSDSDILAGATMGMRTILIADKPSPGNGMDAMPSAIAGSLIEVVETYFAQELSGKLNIP